MGRNRPTRKRGKNISSIYSHPIQSPKDLLILHSSVCVCVCVCAEFLRANKKPNLKIVSSVSLSFSLEKQQQQKCAQSDSTGLEE